MWDLRAERTDDARAIDALVDRCFGPEIVTISLVSSCEFRLTHARGRLRLSRRLEPGDITVLKGDARTVWRHEILQHSLGSYDGSAWRRLSVTFRVINPERVHWPEAPSE